MNSRPGPTEAGTEYDKPPFLYEIRVKGRLSAEQWTSWFDDMTLSSAGGESTLRGRVPDHAALYALLARLRDLAIPLVAVKVLDADAQRKLLQWSERYDRMIIVLLGVIYAVLLGGLSAITVFVAPIINPALAIALLFAMLGAAAHAFWLWSGQAVWRWVSYATWPAAAFTFLIYIPVSGLLPPAVGIAAMLFFGAGGLLYLVRELRRRAEDIRSRTIETRLPGNTAEPAGAAAEETGESAGPQGQSSV